MYACQPTPHRAAIQDYNLLEECPSQPGIHPGMTWITGPGSNEFSKVDRESSNAERLTITLTIPFLTVKETFFHDVVAT